jgi:small GTP-binding protein
MTPEVDAIQERILYYEDILVALKDSGANVAESDIQRLERAIGRLKSQKVVVALFGEVNAGKSSLGNSLHGGQDAPFTASPLINTWSETIEDASASEWATEEGWRVFLQDTPGIAGDFEKHREIALRIAGESDVILYIVWQAVKGNVQRKAFADLLASRKPFIVVLNKCDIQRDEEVSATKADLQAKFPDLTEEAFVKASGDPLNGVPDVLRLKTTILEFVRQGREQLVVDTLDSLADGALEAAKKLLDARYESQLIEQSKLLEVRGADRLRLNAHGLVLVGRYAKAASVAAGVLPLGIDFISTTVVTGGMLHNLTKLHGVEMDRKTLAQIGKDLVQAFLLVFSVSSATFVGYQALSKGLKSNPLTYMAGMALDAAFTYFIMAAIGNAFNYYCANEKSWADKGSMQKYLSDWIRENIDSVFLSKLPAKARARFEEKFGNFGH